MAARRVLNAHQMPNSQGFSFASPYLLARVFFAHILPANILPARVFLAHIILGRAFNRLNHTGQTIFTGWG